MPDIALISIPTDVLNTAAEYVISKSADLRTSSAGILPPNGADGAIIASRPSAWTALWITAMFDAAKEIKATVDIRDVAELYGVHFGARNQARCPFHEDKHPSASIKTGGFTAMCAICI